MQVTVTRGTGDNMSLETIVDSLCTVVSVGTERGKQYLYDNGFDSRFYEIKFPYQSIIYPTDLIAIHDATLGDSFVARCVSHSIDISFTDDVVTVDSTILVDRKKIV